MTRYAYWGATFLFLALVGLKFDSETGFTSLIRFGETWQNKRHHSLQNLPVSTALASSGYDGQFYAQIALDPLLFDSELETVIDVPAYRARRILVPAIAALIGGGNPWRVLHAYALLNVACWLVLAWLLRIWIGRNDWLSFVRWAGCMFGVGVLDSVRQSLVDLPAMLLLFLAIRAYEQSHSSKSMLWLALGNLAKETTLIGSFSLTAAGIFNGNQRRRAVVGLVASALPLGVWFLYVANRFDAQPSNEGLGNFSWPFFGTLTHLILCTRELMKCNFDGRYAFGIIGIVGVLLQSFVLWRKPNFKSSWWRVGAAYSLLLPFLSLWVWYGYWAAFRALLPLTISFNILLPADRKFWCLWVAGNLTMIHAVWRFI